MASGTLNNAIDASTRNIYNVADQYKKTGEVNLKQAKDSLKNELLLGTITNGAIHSGHYFLNGKNPISFRKTANEMKTGQSPKKTEQIEHTKKDYDNFKGLESEHIKMGEGEYVNVADRSRDSIKQGFAYEVKDFNSVQDSLDNLHKMGYEVKKTQNGYLDGVDYDKGYRSLNYEVKSKDGQRYNIKFTTPKVLEVEKEVLKKKSKIIDIQEKLDGETNQGVRQDLMRQIQSKKNEIKDIRYKAEVDDANIILKGLGWMYKDK